MYADVLPARQRLRYDRIKAFAEVPLHVIDWHDYGDLWHEEGECCMSGGEGECGSR